MPSAEVDSEEESWTGEDSEEEEEYYGRGNTCCGGVAFVHDEAPTYEDEDHLSSYESNGPFWRSEANAVVTTRMARAGVAGPDTEPTTLPKLAQGGAEEKGDKDMLMVERPVPPLDEEGKWPDPLPPEEWTKWTYAEWLAEVRRAAQGLIQLGFQPYDTVNIWGFNAPEWVMSAMAACFAGGKMAGLYPTDTPEAVAFKIVQSGGTVAVVEDRVKADKIAQALTERGDVQRLRAVVGWGFKPASGEMLTIRGLRPLPLLSWGALLKFGQGKDQELERRVRDGNPGSCAALIYTSGTTGEPKGVMISHDNIIFSTRTCMNVLRKSVGLGAEPKGERLLSYLPLSHVAGMMLDIVAPVLMAAMGSSWMTHYFARPYDLKAGSLKDRLNSARPTLFLGVPLVWEKIADKLRAIGASTPAPLKKLSDWAKGLGLEHAKNCQLGGSGKYPFGYRLASTLVLSKIKKALGMEELKFGLTGAAPIRADTLEYFASLGISINESYGMSECCGATTWSIDQAHAWGSCGFQLPGTQVKAFKVDDRDFNRKTECPRAPNLDAVNEEQYQGELCFRGRHVMMGYMANPDLGSAHVQEIQKKNAETIDRDGWLHSGDKGMITEAGLIKITGRYKELIIGEGGENIAPVPIEDCVKKNCDGLAEVMMVGDHRKYNVALVTLKAVNEESNQLAAAAARLNPEVPTISAAMDDKKWIDEVTKAIKAANNNGKVCPNNAFKIQKFTILPMNFSEERGHLTPTKKLKRKAVESEFAAMVERMYQTDGVYIRYQA